MITLRFWFPSCFLLLWLVAEQFAPLLAAAAEVPQEAARWKEVEQGPYRASRLGKVLWLEMLPAAVEAKRISLPKLNASISRLTWVQSEEKAGAIRVAPEPDQWWLSWEKRTAAAPILRLEFDVKPTLPSENHVCEPAGDGSILLPAYGAQTFGKRLRYEPQPVKNTVGYWTEVDDYVSWQLNVTSPGTYAVAVLQGCGRGQGGSTGEVLLSQRDVSLGVLEFVPTDTGHFQNFRWFQLGFIRVPEAGQCELRIRAKAIAKAAFCDVRAVHLIKQANP